MLSQYNEFPTPFQVGPVPTCISRNGIPCYTIAYSPANNTWIDAVMKEVASSNSLTFGKDIISMGGGTNITADNSTLYDYLLNNQNTTQNAIFFTSRNIFVIVFF